MRPLDEIRGNFDEGLKREVMEGEKLPFTMRNAGVDEFYGVLSDRYRRDGRAVIGKEYLKDVLSAFPDNVKIALLYNGDEAVDPVAYYQYKDRSAFWIWPAGRDTVSHGSAYAAWDLIKNKKAEGLASLEIPGASERRQNAFISKFNAPLIYNFAIARNDLKGRIGGGMYRNLIKVRI
jgi:hypothetical protein